MKRFSPMITIVALLLVFDANTASSANTQFESQAKPHRAHHIVVVWLKQHGDQNARRQYIEASKKLAKLPGLLAYNIGIPANIKRERPSPGVDDTYDIAISSTFDSQQALEDYSKNLEHNKIIEEDLKPLVDRYKVYDFID